MPCLTALASSKIMELPQHWLYETHDPVDDEEIPIIHFSQVRLAVVLRLPDRVDRVRQDRCGGVGAAVRRGAGHAALLRPLRVPTQEQQGRRPLERGHHRRGQGKCINNS